MKTLLTALCLFYASLLQAQVAYSNTSIDNQLIEEKGYSNSSISKLSNSNKSTIFPNPSSDFIHIKTPTRNNHKIKIYNSSGKEVKKIRNYRGTDLIDITKLSSGIYIIMIIDSENSILLKTEKLIVK